CKEVIPKITGNFRQKQRFRPRHPTAGRGIPGAPLVYRGSPGGAPLFLKVALLDFYRKRPRRLLGSGRATTGRPYVGRDDPARRFQATSAALVFQRHGTDGGRGC